MANFPQLVGVATSANDESNPLPGGYVVTLPADIDPGELLVIAIGLVAGNIVTPASGWTQLYNSSTTGIHIYFYYKTADGSETTATFVPSADTDVAWVAQRIDGWQGTPEAGTSVTGISTTPNPPNVTASWGSDDNLFLAVLGHANSAPPTNPANYGSQIGSPNTANPDTYIAFRELAAASDNPGTFTSANSFWSANTVVIRGAEIVDNAIIPLAVHHRKQQGIQ